MPRKDPCSELAKTITQLAMNIGSRPEVTSLADVTTEMQKHIPEITRDEIVRSIVEATTGYAEAQTAIQKKLAQLKREAKSDVALRAAIEEYTQHLNQQTQPAKRAAAKAASPVEIKALETELADLKKSVAEADPARRAELQSEIDTLQRHIDQGTHPEPSGPKRPAPADIESLRAEKSRLRAELDVTDPAKLAAKRAEKQARIDELQAHLRAGTLPAPRERAAVAGEDAMLGSLHESVMRALRNSEPAVRQRFESQIANLHSRLEDGVQLPGPAHPPAPMTRELERLAYQRDRLRSLIGRELDALKPKGIWGRVAEPLNLARAIMTSADLSAVLRQGGFIALGNPVRAARSIVPMLRAFTSAEAAHRINAEIADRENAPLYARSELYLAPESGGALNAQEEAFMSRLAGRIPFLAGSERAYNTFLNKLRADSFDAMVNTLGRRGEVTQTEARAIANYINVATGRGTLGGMEQAAPAMATAFFAPRYVVSRFELLAGQPLYGGTRRTRALIAGEYAKLIAGLLAVLGLGLAAGGTLETDPRSSDFGKLRFGDTRLDPLMGLAQVTTLVGRLATGERKDANGKIVPIRGPEVPYGAMTSADVVANFLRSKLAPIPGAAVDLAAGKNVVGEPVTPRGVATKLVLPLSFGDIYEVMRNEGIGRGTAFAGLALFGMGLQHYTDKKTAQKQERETLQEKRRSEAQQRTKKGTP